MIDYLKQLVIKGFVPLEDRDDEIAKIISNFGIGGVISKTSDVIGFDYNIWKQYPDVEYGIVPAKQSIRLVIAKVIYKLLISK